MRVNIGGKYVRYEEGHCCGENCGVDLRGKEVHEYASFPVNVEDPDSELVDGKTHYMMFCPSCWAKKMSGTLARSLFGDSEIARSSILRHTYFEQSAGYYGLADAKEEFKEDQERFHVSLTQRMS